METMNDYQLELPGEALQELQELQAEAGELVDNMLAGVPAADAELGETLSTITFLAAVMDVPSVNLGAALLTAVRRLVKVTA